MSLIALDWGTTSLRAYLLDSNGNVLDKKSALLGILKVPNNDFDTAFEDTCGSWLKNGREASPILASGMIGSRQGWTEAPYVACPAGAEQLAQKLIHITTKKLRKFAIVPGISTENSTAVPDVMRGEETQIIGALDDETSSHLFVLPGTHSKWARVEQNQIVQFATFMTGEVFALLCEHSILGRTMQGRDDDVDAFRRGCDYALTQAINTAGLLQLMFSARTLALFNRVPATGLYSYLSGLLIGSEILGSQALFGEHHLVTIIAEPDLARLYQRALSVAQQRANIAAETTTPTGLFRLARASGMI